MKRVAIVMFATALAATAAHAQPAHAQPAASNDQVARDHYDRGKQLAADGQFAAAYGEFSAGYDASPRALFLFNMAECERQLGNAPRARDFYERFLAASPNDALAQTARTRLSELPAASPPTVPPPVKAVDVAPTPAITTAPPGATPAIAQEQRSLVAPVATGISALAVGGLALGFDLWSQSTYTQSKTAADAKPAQSVLAGSLWTTANNQLTTAAVLGGAAAIGAGVAIWLYVRGDHHDHETTARRTRVVPTAGGMAVVGSF
jgi:tetratricopeptide (TPR) repeat protein